MAPKISVLHPLLVLLLLYGCGRGPLDAPTVAADPSINVVLITIDTLRSDHLGCYGYTRETSPNIDRFAEESVLFENARATCSATAPSVASILTGAHPASHGVARNGSVFPDVVQSAAEMFRDSGYVTRGIVSNPTLGPDLGFGQGFDQFGLPSDLNSKGPGRFGGPPVAQEAVEAIRQWHETGDRFFLWTHFMDPHGAYAPPEEYQALFPSADYEVDGPGSLVLIETNYGMNVVPKYQRLTGQRPGDMLEVADIRARYDAEIRYVDVHVGRILDELTTLGMLNDTVVVLTADHGESLGEHEYFFQHGWYLYDDCLKVPLLFRVPGQEGGLGVAAGVSLVDLLPTILDIAGIAVPPQIEGSSLVGWHSDMEGRAAYSQTYYGNQLTSLTVDGLKVVYTPPPPDPSKDDRKVDGWKDYWPDETRFEFYDLAADPGELNDLAASGGAEFSELRQQLTMWLNVQNSRHQDLMNTLRRSLKYGKQVRKLERDVRFEEQLRALGYLD